jgi:hypothetical protein
MSGYEISMSPVKHGLSGWMGVGIRATGNCSWGNGEYRRDKQTLTISEDNLKIHVIHSKAARVILGSSN